MGARNAILRRTARSWAAPLACHAAHRWSKSADSGAVVNGGACGGAATVGTAIGIRPSRKRALVRAGPGRPRAQKSRNHNYRRSQDSATVGQRVTENIERRKWSGVPKHSELEPIGRLGSGRCRSGVKPEVLRREGRTTSGLGMSWACVLYPTLDWNTCRPYPGTWSSSLKLGAC